jgi:hydroxymethylglutaryl-CoA reductase
MAVAIIRAVNRHCKLGLADTAVNELAFKCETLAHGSPSGIDNSVATYAVPMLFSNASGLQIQELELAEQPPLLIAFSSQRGSTLEQVEAVRARYATQAPHYDLIFDAIDQLSQAGAKALQSADYEYLGRLMDTCHGLLSAIGVSTPELDDMVAIARSAGAAGAKLTGSGGGGAIVALCPGNTEQVGAALAAAGYETLATSALKER